MKKIKLRKLIFFAASCALTILALAQIVFPPLNNWKLLLAGERNSYTLLRPFGSTEEMMQELYEKTNIRFGSICGPEVMTPTKDIVYYSAPNGLKPVYTLKAGHTYAILHTDGYGFVTWPTHSREWRYTKPFVEVDKEEYLETETVPFEEMEALPDCYIRLSDLKELASEQSAVLELDPFYGSAPQLYSLDEIMQHAGYWFSPNLPYWILDSWNVIFLAVSLLLLVAAILWLDHGRNRKNIPLRQTVCIVLACLMTGGSLIQIFFPETNNWKLTVGGKTTLYARYGALDLEELMVDYSSVPGVPSLSSLTEYSLMASCMIEPTRDIHYYASPWSLKPVYTMKAGEKYIYQPEAGYGFCTWPTYMRGWRYGRPFYTEEEYSKSTFGAAEEYGAYYIRYSDLMDLMEGRAAKLYMPFNSTEELTGIELQRRVKNIREQIDFFDRGLYDRDLFYSPELKRQIWDGFNITLFSAGVILLAVSLFWKWADTKKKKASVGEAAKNANSKKENAHEKRSSPPL